MRLTLGLVSVRATDIIIFIALLLALTSNIFTIQNLLVPNAPLFFSMLEAGQSAITRTQIKANLKSFLQSVTYKIQVVGRC